MFKNNNRINVTPRLNAPRRVNGQTAPKHGVVFWVVVAIILTALISNSGMAAGLMADAGAILGYYWFIMLILTIMMYTHKADNVLGHMMYLICSPVFNLVSHFVSRHFNDVHSDWWAPIISIILLIVVQQFVSSL